MRRWLIQSALESKRGACAEAGLCRFQLGLRRPADAAEGGNDGAGTAFAVRRCETRRRVLLQRFQQRLWARNAFASILQCLRPAPEPILDVFGRDLEIYRCAYERR